MNLSDSEKIDRLTIEILKETDGRDCADLVSELYRLNYLMWYKEEEISREKEDHAEVGRLYLELRELTKDRAKIKKEFKTY